MRKGISCLFLCLLFFLLQVPPVRSQPGAGDSLIRTDRAFDYMNSLDSMLHLRNAEADSLRRLQQRAHTFEKDSGPSFLASLFNSPVVKFLFWAFLAVFLFFIIFRLFRFHSATPRQQGSEMPEGEEVLQDDAWYEKQIALAEQQANFVEAVRLRFRRLLARLNDAERIAYTPEKTNAAYAREIQDETLRRTFLQISLVYEYVWYGKKPVSATRYADLVTIFERNNSDIH